MVFIESREFTRRLQALARESAGEVLQRIQKDLLESPQRGALVQGLGGIRKARVANPGRHKGKRGGFRYLYLFMEHRGHIHLLYLLDKDEREDLFSEERAALRKMVSILKES